MRVFPRFEALFLFDAPFCVWLSVRLPLCTESKAGDAVASSDEDGEEGGEGGASMADGVEVRASETTAWCTSAQVVVVVPFPECT